MKRTIILSLWWRVRAPYQGGHRGWEGPFRYKTGDPSSPHPRAHNATQGKPWWENLIWWNSLAKMHGGLCNLVYCGIIGIPLIPPWISVDAISYLVSKILFTLHLHPQDMFLSKDFVHYMCLYQTNITWTNTWMSGIAASFLETRTTPWNEIIV